MVATAPVIVLGSGLAAYTFVREWRKLDADTPCLMITRDDGHSYSKPMLSTGLTKNKTADGLSMADPGVMAQQLKLSIRNFTEVTAIDPAHSCIHIGNETLIYSKLILALGAHVNTLNFPGATLDRVVSINDLMDYRRFRSLLPEKGHILIMGAGLIGCEYANDLLNADYSVTIVDPSETPMSTLIPAEAGHCLTAGLAKAGARWKFGHHVHEISALENDQLCVSLNDGHKVLCDLVISAIGLRPEIRLAAAAGIQCHRGIVTNRYLETSADTIYALGDCAETGGEVRLYVLPLMASARALAKTIAGERTAVDFGIMPVTTKTPACPVITVPPAASSGKWTFQLNGELDLIGRFINEHGELQGFVLTGAATSEKQTLVQEMNHS
jgi:rubredoxin-NAD+ reductase